MSDPSAPGTGAPQAGNATTGSVTSGSVTSGSVTSGSVTTGRVTTGRVTTGRVTANGDSTGVSRGSVAARAAAATTWAEMSAVVRGCEACAELVRTRTQVVPGVLPAGARLLLVGEAPGAQEDARGVPFVGRAGVLLDEMLAEAGLDRAGIGVVNVLKCRPPANRPPSRAEITMCRPWLDRQVQLADPDLIVALGLTAASWAVGARVPLVRQRGRLHRLAADPDRLALVSYHPSAALRFGPAGLPRAALAADLRQAAQLLASSLIHPESTW